MVKAGGSRDNRRMTISEELSRLSQMHQQGLLTDAEFSAAKARVLGAPAGSSPAHTMPAAGWAPPTGSQLRRSGHDRWIGGVCGGLARATGVEAWIWRLALVIFALFGGSGVLAYVLLWIFIPPEPAF